MKSDFTYLIKKKAQDLGFFYCGISKAEFLEDEAPRLEAWLKAGMNGQMQYMENYFDKRLDPAKLVEGAKSVISLLYNYYTNDEQSDKTAPKISTYAFGKDYHVVIKEKLKELTRFIKERTGNINGRAFVDSAPVLDRAWAKKSGLGWIGKNSNLITKQQGSFFFIAELILDIELEYDTPIKDYCGSCNRCMEACPTEAIIKPYVVDGSKCISYFTIELKDEVIPDEMKGKFKNWAFGCDICQNVCPWNRFSKPHKEPAFNAKKEMLDMSKKEWEEITEEIFERIVAESALKRAKFKGLKRNINFLMQAAEKPA